MTERAEGQARRRQLPAPRCLPQNAASRHDRNVHRRPLSPARGLGQEARIWSSRATSGCHAALSA